MPFVKGIPSKCCMEHRGVETGFGVVGITRAVHRDKDAKYLFPRGNSTKATMKAKYYSQLPP